MTKALVLLALLAVTHDKVELRWQPAKGAIGTFKTTNSHKADFNGSKEDLVITWESKLSIDKVEKDKVWIKSESGEPLATLAGEDASFIQVEIPDTTEIHGLDGKFYPDAEDHGATFGIFGGFQLPQGPVEKGETYTIDKMKATYVGLEKVGEWECHKFTFEARGKEKAPWCEGTIWLSTKDLNLVRRKSVLHDFDFGMGPETINNEIVRIK